MFCVCRFFAWNGICDAVSSSAFAAAVLLTPYTVFAADKTPDLAATERVTVMYPSAVPVQLYNPGVAVAALDATVVSPTLPKPLDGLNFGAGIAVTFGQQRVVQAKVINNIVRVTEVGNVMAGIVFEFHYFFVPNIPFLGGLVGPSNWGHGPFVAVDVSTGDGSNVLAGVSMGYMVGFRRTRLTTLDGKNHYLTTDNNSWNFGVGFRVDPRATVLGDGVVANLPPPTGETDARLKTVPRYGVMLLTSFSF